MVFFAALAVFLLARNGEASTSSPPKPGDATSSAASLSSDCRLAILDWATTASAMHSDLIFGKPDHARDNVSASANKVTVYCAKAIAARVADVDYRLVLNETRLVGGQATDPRTIRSIGSGISGIRSLAG